MKYRPIISIAVYLLIFYLIYLVTRSFVYVNGGIFSGHCSFNALNYQV